LKLRNLNIVNEMELINFQTEREKNKEMNIWKQKLRYLMGEQTEKLAKVRLHNLWSMKRVQDEIWEIIMMLRDGLVDKHQQLRAMEYSKYAMLQHLQHAHSDEVKLLRAEFAREVKRMSEQTERHAGLERDVIEEQNSKELVIIRAKKEEQIDHMLYMHEKQLLEMKTFFNDLEVNNMAVITSLQQEIAAKKVTERRLQRGLAAIKERYDLMMVPVHEAEVNGPVWEAEKIELEKVRKEIEAGENQVGTFAGETISDQRNGCRLAN